ncbi:transglutaminase domain-containing protein [Candidatus Bathyarchaeota archaeon]|nr:transglutaminase domain-containing protein [Candidatus Bathyarchaeota archaeon]
MITEPSRLLHDATLKLGKGELKEAIDLVTKASKEIRGRLLLKNISPSEYSILKQLSYLLDCAALQYFILSKEEGIGTNDVSKLGRLCLSLGICNVLETLLLPLVRTYSSLNHEKQESSWLCQFNELLKQEIHDSVKRVVRDIRNERLRGPKEELNRSIKKIVNSADPTVEVVRELATRLGRRFEAGDFKQARKLYEYVRDEIQYIYDPFGIEEIQPPEVTLKLRSGDCEDQAILLTSLLLAIGFESALLFADANNDGLPDHVYSAVYIPKAPDYTKPFAKKKLNDGKNLHDWIPLDPTSLDSDFGVIPIEDLQIAKLVSIQAKKQKT